MKAHMSPGFRLFLETASEQEKDQFNEALQKALANTKNNSFLYVNYDLKPYNERAIKIEEQATLETFFYYACLLLIILPWIIK